MKFVNMIKTIVPALILGGSFVAVAAPDAPAKASHSPIGYWFTGVDEEIGKRRAKVELYPCGAKICGKIVALREPIDPETKKPKLDVNNPDESKRSQPVLGMQMVMDMAPEAGEPNKWSGGTIYDAKKGKTYSGSFTMPDNDNLHLRGFVLGMPMLGRTNEWIRTTESAGFQLELD